MKLSEKFVAQFFSSELVRSPTEILHKITQGSFEPQRDYMSQFSKVALVVKYFADQTE